RKHVHAIYALCRLADDIVDLPNGQGSIDAEPDPIPAEPEPVPPEPDLAAAEEPDDSSAEPETTPTEPEAIATEPDPTIPELVDPRTSVSAQLEAFAEQFRTSLAAGDSTDPVMAAVVHTVITCGIDPECFDRFFNAMAMDLTTTSYQTWEDLCTYMEGSAAVIGEMMLPVLEPISEAAKPPARSLGLAFQLTNFLRDVDEDLDRGRVYLPQDDLRLFDVDLGRRSVTPEWRAFLAYEIERNRALYSFADTGIAMLPPRSARCVGTARVLYAQILDQIERNDYDVFSRRARVPTVRKAATAARIMVTGPRTPNRQAELYQRRSMTDVTQDTY
ncbi:MAG TPA: phytoene/squalene synthase family protein, partial [Propionibacteriaceae bacterium]|nr:phytoene/squalene synthase family protein [Propionibacteriaceae bacterium]